MIRARFLGTGFAVPDRVVTNDDLSAAHGHERRVDPDPDRHPGAALGPRGRDRRRSGPRGHAPRARGRGPRAGDARRHHLRHLHARPFRPGQRRLPPAAARHRHDSLDRHPEPVQRLRLRAGDGGRVHPLRPVPPRARGRRRDPVHRHGRDHAGPEHRGALRRRRRRRGARPDRRGRPRHPRLRPPRRRHPRREALGRHARARCTTRASPRAARAGSALPGDGRQGGVPPRRGADAGIGPRRARRDRPHDRPTSSSSWRTRPTCGSRR